MVEPVPGYGSPDVVAHKTDPRVGLLIGGKRGEIDLTKYTFPGKKTPLAKQLSKLLPPNESTINYFTNLLDEKSEKCMNKELLANFASAIFGSILVSVEEVLKNKDDYSPADI